MLEQVYRGRSPRSGPPPAGSFLPNFNGAKAFRSAVHGSARARVGLRSRLLYRSTSLTRKCTLLGPYSRTMPRALG